ncbi:hypothetical protein Syun_023742 [Stephania yunnanensis]|uniref:Uncharacterized protein n=1 Tax=Stephania yunnanensis TaxID=152371 RepID=A0AAP0I3H7_9MAGN
MITRRAKKNQPPPPPPPPPQNEDSMEEQNEEEDEEENEQQQEQIPEEFIFDVVGDLVYEKLLFFAQQAQRRKGKAGRAKNVIFSKDRGRYIKPMLPKIRGGYLACNGIHCLLISLDHIEVDI